MVSIKMINKTLDLIHDICVTFAIILVLENVFLVCADECSSIVKFIFCAASSSIPMIALFHRWW